MARRVVLKALADAARYFFVVVILALPKSSTACMLFVIRSHENRVALENLGEMLQTEHVASLRVRIARQIQLYTYQNKAREVVTRMSSCRLPS